MYAADADATADLRDIDSIFNVPELIEFMDNEFQHEPFNVLPLRRPDVLSVLTTTRVPTPTLCVIVVLSATSEYAPIALAFDTRRSVSTLRRAVMAACERHWSTGGWLVVPSLAAEARGRALFREDTSNILSVEKALHDGILPLGAARHHVNARSAIPSGSAPLGLCVQNAQRASDALRNASRTVSKRLYASPTIGPVIRGINDVVDTARPCSVPCADTCSCVFEYMTRRARAGALVLYALTPPPPPPSPQLPMLCNDGTLENAADRLIRRMRGYAYPSAVDLLVTDENLPPYLRCAAFYALYHTSTGRNDERLCAAHVRAILHSISKGHIMAATTAAKPCRTAMIMYIHDCMVRMTPPQPFVAATQQQFAAIGWTVLLVNELFATVTTESPSARSSPSFFTWNLITISTTGGGCCVQPDTSATNRQLVSVLREYTLFEPPAVKETI